MAETVSRFWRLELFFKSVEELKTKTIPFLKEQQFHRLNLTNKVSLVYLCPLDNHICIHLAQV